MSRASRSPAATARRVCRSKKSFASVKEAAIQCAADWINSGYLNRPYECAVCGKFHNTSKREEITA
jgi:hypothetical protein